MSNELKISSAALHILDKTLGAPMLSDHFLPLEEGLEEYLQKHMGKCFSDEEAKGIPLEQIRPEIKDALRACLADSGQVMALGRSFATEFYGMITAHDIQDGDLLVLDFISDQTRYFGVLKLNYRKSYVHNVLQGDGISNTILCNRFSLPGEGQKIDEFLIFDFKENQVLVKEKRHRSVSGGLCFISDAILGVSYVKSDKEKLKNVKKAAAAVVEKYFTDDVTAEMAVEESVYNSYYEKGSVSVEEMGQRISRGIQSVKEEFIEEVKRQGIEEEEIPFNDNMEKVIAKKYKITTENGVELKLPIELLKQKEKFEIVNNPDGSLSIMIKNVSLV